MLFRSPALDAKYDAYVHKAGVWCLSNPWPAGPDRSQPCKYLLAAHNIPLPMLRKAAPEVAPAHAVRAWLRGIFAALATLGSQGGTERLPRTVRMTLIFQAQAKAPQEAPDLRTIVETCSELLLRSPVVQRLDIAFFLESERGWLDSQWQELLGQSEASVAQEAELAPTLDLLKRRCLDAIEVLRTVHATDLPLTSALQGLTDCLKQDTATSSQLGFATRLVVEKIVDNIHQRIGSRGSGSLMDSIERLADQHRYARWFLSYLHTLRSVGNEAVHLVSLERARPRRMEAVDHVVLLSALLRVLTVVAAPDA